MRGVQGDDLFLELEECDDRWVETPIMNGDKFQATLLGHRFRRFAFHQVPDILGDIDGVPPPGSAYRVVLSHELLGFPGCDGDHFENILIFHVTFIFIIFFLASTIP